MGKTKQSVIDHRRMIVARLRVRGLSQREIQVRLAIPGEDGRMVTANPANNKPWSLGTINGDCKALDKMWRAAAEADIVDWKAWINAELEEVKREGWRDKDSKAVLAAIAQQRAMLGLDAPKTVQGPGEKGEWTINFASSNIDPEKL